MNEMRAGDADRDGVALVLREAHADGRLDLDELEQRLTATYAARTMGELSALTADLPVPVPASQPPASADAPAVRSTDVRLAWRAWAVAVSLNVVIWLLVSASAGDLVYFWPMWVAGPWGAVLLVRTVTSR